MMKPIKITIPTHSDPDFVAASPTSEETVAAIRSRLEASEKATPLTPETLAERDLKATLLAKLDIEAKQERARRANERVMENKARKLRIEAAAVARASSKLEKSSCVVATCREQFEAKRQAAAQRRASLYHSVRDARQARQVEQAARLANLAELESKAKASKAKLLAATIAKNAAQVRHAAQVAAELKAKAKDARDTAATNLKERLEAAASRRDERITATVKSASSVCLSAERTRLRQRYDDRTAAEGRRLRLEHVMDNALGRRTTVMEERVTKLRQEHERVAEVVNDTKLEAMAKPETLKHKLAVRMQAADVTRQQRMARKRPEVIIVDLGRQADATALPPTSLLHRLLFKPRILMATAKARHTAARGRRERLLAVVKLKAAHFGTVRVATAQGRRALLEEVTKSILHARFEAGIARARAQTQAKAKRASKMNARVISTKLRRSQQRLDLLNRAIDAEGSRQMAHLRRESRLLDVARGRVAEANAAAVKARREMRDGLVAVRAAAYEQRCTDATLRRGAHLVEITSKFSATEAKHAATMVVKAAIEAAFESVVSANGDEASSGRSEGSWVDVA